MVAAERRRAKQAQTSHAWYTGKRVLYLCICKRKGKGCEKSRAVPFFFPWIVCAPLLAALRRCLHLTGTCGQCASARRACASCAGVPCGLQALGPLHSLAPVSLFRVTEDAYVSLAEHDRAMRSYVKPCQAAVSRSLSTFLSLSLSVRLSVRVLGVGAQLCDTEMACLCRLQLRSNKGNRCQRSGGKGRRVSVYTGRC